MGVLENIISWLQLLFGIALEENNFGFFIILAADYRGGRRRWSFKRCRRWRRLNQLRVNLSDDRISRVDQGQGERRQAGLVRWAQLIQSRNFRQRRGRRESPTAWYDHQLVLHIKVIIKLSTERRNLKKIRSTRVIILAQQGCWTIA